MERDPSKEVIVLRLAASEALASLKAVVAALRSENLDSFADTVDETVVRVEGMLERINGLP